MKGLATELEWPCGDTKVTFHITVIFTLEWLFAEPPGTFYFRLIREQIKVSIRWWIFRNMHPYLKLRPGNYLWMNKRKKNDFCFEKIRLSTSLEITISKLENSFHYWIHHGLQCLTMPQIMNKKDLGDYIACQDHMTPS